eukprot:g39065.t1
MREKLIRLQSLYIDQFRRLQYLLKEKRRQYLQACRLERESFDILQDPSQVLFKTCPGLSEVPCAKPVMVCLSEEPRCPLHLQVPPLMYRPEAGSWASEQLGGGTSDMYLSAAELQPTEILPLEFSD